MYKSSPFTSVLKYIIPVVIITVYIAAIYQGINTIDDNHLQRSITVLVCFFTLPMIISIITSLKLKNVIATENGIEVNSSGKKETILYKDIECIVISHPFNLWAVSFKYYDKKLRKHKLLSYLPNHKYRVKGELNIMRKHIEDKFVEENPKFSKKKQPKSVHFLMVPSLLSIAFAAIGFIVYINVVV